MSTGDWVLATLTIILAVAVLASHVRLTRQMERDICAVFRAGMECERARANAPDRLDA